MYEIISENISNARNAITKKRYDLVTIQGNRILSDLAILSDGVNREDRLLIAFQGFVLRRVGTDLQLLANFQKDTAKIKSVAIEILSSRDLDKGTEASMFTLFRNYVKYLDHLADEINSNDFAEYTREGRLNRPLFDWIMRELSKINEEAIIYGSPIQGLNQELRRMSYVEKLSQTNVVIQILLEALEWHSDTVKAGVSKFIGINNAAAHPAIFKELIEQVNKFVNSIKNCLAELNGDKMVDLTESEIKSYLVALPEILIAWRNLLNMYYNLQTAVIPRNSEKQEKHTKDGDVDD
jgi:hypothetical protein